MISAWKPLQIPPIRPSLFLRSSLTLYLIAAFLKKAVINFPEPSGSSPPEKPPGMNTICDFDSFSAKAFTDSRIASEERFLMTNISGSAPPSARAFAVSNSQFVPGNTGISA